MKGKGSVSRTKGRTGVTVRLKMTRAQYRRLKTHFQNESRERQSFALDPKPKPLFSSLEEYLLHEALARVDEAELRAKMPVYQPATG